MQILLNRLKFFTLVLFAISLIACGGGGEGANPIGGGSGDGGTDGGGDVGGDDGNVSGDGFSLSIRLYEESVSISGFVAGALPDIDTITSVNSIESGLVAVGVVDSDGNPVSGEIIALSASLGVLSPASGAIITNSNGVAAANLESGSAESGAAGVLTAVLDGFDASLNYSIGSVDLKLGRDSNADGDDSTYSSGDYVDGEIENAVTNLSPTGSTELTVVVVDSDDELFTSPLTVSFSSACAELSEPLATIDTSVSTVGGVATSTYTAAGCEGSDPVTASIDEVPGVTAVGTVQIQAADANSIIFISANPENIALRGTGGAERPELSTLIFRVLDEADQPAQGELVTFGLSTSTGGITLTDTSGITNSNGDVTVGVNSGSVPTPVTVTANLDLDGDPVTTDDIVSTVSDTLVVSTGLPDNNSFSIDASIRAPGGNDVDGVESLITVRSADAFNNPVPDGTAINFTSEYGRIDSSCTTIGGECSVTWNSQNPKAPDLSSTGLVLTLNDPNVGCDTDNSGVVDPDEGMPLAPCINDGADNGVLDNFLLDFDDPDFPGQIYGGRSTITASSIGEESFIDSNGNGRYDLGEPFTDLPEAYIDHNEDAIFGNAFSQGGCTDVGVGTNIPSDVVDINDIDEDDNTTELIGASTICAQWEEGGAEEEFVDFDSNGDYDYGNGIYNGSLCREEDELLGICSRELVNVRTSMVLVAGDSTPVVGIYENRVLIADDNGIGNLDIDVTGGMRTITIAVSDRFNGILPTGTEIEWNSQTIDNCLVGPTPAEEVVLNTSRKGISQLQMNLQADTDTTITTSGSVGFSITLPDRVGGAIYSYAFTCTDG